MVIILNKNKAVILGIIALSTIIIPIVYSQTSYATGENKTFRFGESLKQSLDTAEYTNNQQISYSGLVTNEFTVYNWDDVKLADKLDITSQAAVYGYDPLD